MHLPDSFLDATTALATAGLAVVGLGAALHHARRHLPPRKVPLMGLAAAFVFAAQMINFPVAGGTSGHIVGGVLTAVLLGPSAAVIVLTAVLIVQCLMFADGGITALGANVLNMGIISAVGGWAVYFAVSRCWQGRTGRILAAILAAWASTVLAAIACAGELAVSHTISWNAAFPAMAGIHILIGVGEAAITALVLVALSQTRPELLDESVVGGSGSGGQRSYGMLAIYGAVIALALALFVSPFAAQWPDGLDKTAERLGFAERAKVLVNAPMPEYQIASLGKLSTSIAGAVGTLMVLGLAWGLARLVVPKPAPVGAQETGSETKDGGEESPS